METHKITIFDKKVKITDKSVFRIEERKMPRGAYEGIYAHKDLLKAVDFYNNTKPKLGWLVRLIKDGDEYMLITKKTS